MLLEGILSGVEGMGVLPGLPVCCYKPFALRQLRERGRKDHHLFFKERWDLGGTDGNVSAPDV